MRLILFSLVLLILASLPDPAAPQVVPASSELVLMPGDVLQVVIWREENLSGVFQVDRDGVVVLPLLGERTVVGRPWGEVKDELLEGYRGELRNPSIELTPFRTVYVLGEVRLPGLYQVQPTHDNLAGAVALAGGATPQGDVTKLKVVREGTIVLDGIPGERGLAALGIRSGDQIFVARRGWFDRNSTFLVSALLSLTSIVVTLVIAR